MNGTKEDATTDSEERVADQEEVLSDQLLDEIFNTPTGQTTEEEEECDSEEFDWTSVPEDDEHLSPEEDLPEMDIVIHNIYD
jgi:hypothetical protein